MKRLGTWPLCLLAAALTQVAAANGGPAMQPRTEPLAGPQAVVEIAGHYETDTFRLKAKLYTNRTYGVDECPDWLRGMTFVRNEIEDTHFRCARAGIVTLLTPDPEARGSSTMARVLEGLGFVRIVKPDLFQLFGKKEIDRVRVYQKRLDAGDELPLRKWVVLLGVEVGGELKIPPPKPWTENDGELLDNGIRLPRVWPPQRLDPRSADPMPVPYLEHPPKVVPIDVGRQLFVDGFLVETSSLERTFHLATKYEGNPVLKPETPWELNGDKNSAACPKGGGVWWDAGKQRFRMWYEAGWIGTVCYAESADGIHWERVNQDVDPGTNRVLPASFHVDSWTVFPDYDTDDPSQRWKLFVRGPGGNLPGYSFVSPDGIHWSEPIRTGDTGDRSTMFYNPFRKKWVYSLRSGVRGRSRHYWEHSDFLKGATWSPFDMFLADDCPVYWCGADRLDPPDPEIKRTCQLYNLDAVAYESIMLGLFEIHRGPENDVCARQGLPKITELNLAYSRDGFHWERPDRRTFIAATRKDTWDRGYVQPVGGICTVQGDKLWFYYTGFRGDATRTDPNWMKNGMYHDASTGIAFLRRDGFAGMKAGAEAGSLTTRPVRFSGSHLFVNVDCPAGELRAEVLDVDGKPIAPYTLANCVSVQADSTLHRVTWRNVEALAGLAGKPVRLRFQLRKGELYSFWVSDSESGRSNGYIAAGGPGYSGFTDTVGAAALGAASRR
jgi:hypothetical protein